MEWRVVKTGIEMFDTLHAYGVGVVVACATGGPVELQDEGCSYQLSCPCTAVPQATIDLLDEVFQLPRADEVLRVGQSLSPRAAVPLAMANLDGLLAALFTRPDVVRCCSLAVLLHKQRFDTSIVERAIASVRSICTDWKRAAARDPSPGSSWLAHLLEGYDAGRPRQPLLRTNPRGDAITVTMPLDPSLGYASRRSLSDGWPAKKVNLTVRGTPFAALLAYVGAMRFLRGQPVAGNLIAYSIPIAATLTLHTGSARPLLWAYYEDEPEQALVLQGLDLVTGLDRGEGRWKALSYQVLQAQGKQQAISRWRGTLGLSSVERLSLHSGGHLLRYWQRLLRAPRKERPCEVHQLVEALVTSRREVWEAHLFEVSRAELAQTARQGRKDQLISLRLYSISEVQEVSAVMESSLPTPLSVVLEHRDGSMRFGHALRQLREQASWLAREILEDLESVRTRDQLVGALTRAMQACEVMDAKSPFMIIPSDRDLKALLDDVERFGAPTIAGLLRLLSTLHYPSAWKRPASPKARRGAPSSLNSMMWRRRLALKRLSPQDGK